MTNEGMITPTIVPIRSNSFTNEINDSINWMDKYFITTSKEQKLIFYRKFISLLIVFRKNAIKKISGINRNNHIIIENEVNELISITN